MNSERWSEITKSFGATQVLTEVEKIRSDERKNVAVLHAESRHSHISHGHSTEHPNISHNKHGITNVDDAPGKIIENLCKIIRDKTEKIKIQEQLINSLRYEKSKSRVAHTDEKLITSNTVGESVTEKVKTADSCVDATFLKEIALKVDSLERRLTTVINFVQRKFPKEYNTEKKQCMEALNLRTWDKPPILHPKPTYGSFIREIHGRSRCAKSRDLDNELSTQPLIQQSVRSIVPKVRREDEMEMRVQALEGLVVLLKNKMMKKINSRRK